MGRSVGGVGKCVGGVEGGVEKCWGGVAKCVGGVGKCVGVWMEVYGSVGGGVGKCVGVWGVWKNFGEVWESVLRCGESKGEMWREM